MPNATYGLSLSVGGITIQPASIVRTGDHPNPYEVELPPGKSGTLSTRTDNDTGIVTAVGHGLAQNDKVDVFWSGGRRYGMTVGVIAGNDVPIDLGAGDNLPVATTPVVITKQVQINSQIDGDAIQIIGIMAQSADPASATKVNVDMQDSGSASIEVLDLTANQPQIHDIAGGAVNPFTGNVIEKSLAANGSSTETITLKILSLEDSTP
jgi:hypothetical protein